MQRSVAMNVADKLQIKPGQRVAVLRAPQGLELDVDEDTTAEAVLVFVTTAADLEEHGAPLIEAGMRDALAWVAYPKAGQLGTDLNRDVLADLLTQRGLRPVRQIAIDDVWSALRVRPGR